MSANVGNTNRIVRIVGGLVLLEVVMATRQAYPRDVLRVPNAAITPIDRPTLRDSKQTRERQEKRGGAPHEAPSRDRQSRELVDGRGEGAVPDGCAVEAVSEAAEGTSPRTHEDELLPEDDRPQGRQGAEADERRQRSRQDSGRFDFDLGGLPPLPGLRNSPFPFSHGIGV